MKINIEANQFNYREGYVNTAELPYDYKVTQAKPGDLNQICMDSEAKEIIANFVLPKLSHEELPSVIMHWNKKLEINGRLVVSFFDIRQVCREGHYGSLGLEQIHNAIFGEHNENKSIMDMETVRRLLSDLGFRIITITPRDTVIIIEAIKISEVQIG